MCFSQIIQKRPDFAEAWNKRATLYYLIAEYEKSLADCEKVIRRNPDHFGALSGFGMIYLRLGHPEQALQYFQRALDVNPNLIQVRAAVEELKRLLLQRSRESIWPKPASPGARQVRRPFEANGMERDGRGHPDDKVQGRRSPDGHGPLRLPSLGCLARRHGPSIGCGAVAIPGEEVAGAAQPGGPIRSSGPAYRA